MIGCSPVEYMPWERVKERPLTIVDGPIFDREEVSPYPHVINCGKLGSNRLMGLHGNELYLQSVQVQPVKQQAFISRKTGATFHERPEFAHLDLAYNLEFDTLRVLGSSKENKIVVPNVRCLHYKTGLSLAYEIRDSHLVGCLPTLLVRICQRLCHKGLDTRMLTQVIKLAGSALPKRFKVIESYLGGYSFFEELEDGTECRCTLEDVYTVMQLERAGKRRP